MKRSPPGRPWRVVPPALLVLPVLILLGSCSGDSEIAAPEVAPPDIPVRMSQLGSSPPIMSEPFTFGGGGVPPLHVMELQETTLVSVVVSGTLSFSKPNSYCGSTSVPGSALHGNSAGPMGLYGQFRVTVRVAGYAVPLQQDPTDYTRATFEGELGPGVVTVERSDGGQKCSQGQPDGTWLTGSNMVITGTQQLMIKRAGELEPGEPEEGDALVVTLTMSRSEVQPVLDRQFNAVTQYWRDQNTPARLYDVIDLKVQATWQPSGRAASGAAVTLAMEPVDSSGGHPHGPFPRPKGTFFRMEDRPTAEEQQKCGESEPPKCTPGTDLKLTLGEDGIGSAVYRTSGVSGLEVVRATVSAWGDTEVDADTVKIRWPGLVSMGRSGTHYYFWNQNPEVASQRHGNINDWGNITFIKEVRSLFKRYFVEVKTDRFTQGETRFVVTDLSLEWGGLLDVDTAAAWKNAHSLHRAGRDMDLRRRTLLADNDSTRRDRFFELCRNLYPKLSCQEHPKTNPNHFHLRLRGAP